MKTERADRNNMFYQYAFWKVIHDYNEQERKDHGDDGNFIMASQAKDAGLRFYQGLEAAKNARNEAIRKANANLKPGEAPKPELSSAPVQSFVNGVDEIFRSWGKPEPFANEDMTNLVHSGKMQELQNEYRAITKISKTGLSDDGYLPISPYDPRFSRLESVMDRGNELTCVANGSVEKFNDLFDVTKSREVNLLGHLREDGKSGYSAQALNRKLVSAGDLSGLSRLRQYMPADTYKKVSSFVNAGFDFRNMTNEQVRARRKSMGKSVAILQALTDMGYEYEITPDTNAGQLKATVRGTRVNVRVMDTPDHDQFIGRTYDNGATYTFYNTRRTKSGASPDYIDANDAVNLVKFALGEPVVGTDGSIVGTSGEVKHKVSNRWMAMNTTYRSSNGLMARYGRWRDQNGNTAIDDAYLNQTYINVNAEKRSSATTTMLTTSDAANYLHDAVTSARNNYESALDVDRIIKECTEHKGEDGYSPELSNDVNIASIQQGYVDVLMGRSNTLLRPGQDAEDFQAKLDEGGEFETKTPAERAVFEQEMESLVYPSDLSPEEMVRQHAQDAVDYNIGSDTIGADGKRFNPVGVSAYQTSAFSQYRNNDDIVKALRMLGISADELKGNEFYNATVKDKLVKFDTVSAKQMSQLDSSFMKDMFGAIKDTLSRNGMTVADKDILIDDNGVVQYQGTMATTQSISEAQRSGRLPMRTGYIGQIFEPDNEDVVTTKFAGSQNYAFVPGYDATILPNKPGENKTMEERTRLHGYDEQLRRAIQYNVRQNIIDMSSEGEIGGPTNLNGVYRRITGQRFDTDFRQRQRELKMDDQMAHDIIATERQRVRYSNTMRDSATVYAEYSARTFGADPANDTTGDPYVLAGSKNMAIITKDSFGYFDPIATNSTNTTQGLVRYLTNDATVNKDGSITPGAKDGRCALMASHFARHMSFNPSDRQNMTLSNILQAATVTPPVNVTQRTLGGWNFDDAVVVSKKFAETYPTFAHDRSLRPLIIGDKISDPNGNKGVISLVVDPDWTEEEARENNVYEPWKTFHDNPTLDVVMAPFPSTSRFNGGTSRDMMEKPQDFTKLDGTVEHGGMGKMQIIITDKSADAKTHVYDSDDIAQGKGRRASAQLAWALNSKGAKALLREFYGNNTSALSNLRESLIATGFDISDTGKLSVGYQPHEGEVRNVMLMPELKYRTLKSGAQGAVDQKAMTEELKSTLERAGGVMELPFPLKFPSGEPIPPMKEDKSDVISTPEEWAANGYAEYKEKEVKDKDGNLTLERPEAVHYLSGKAKPGTTWGLPVLSAYMRSGQEFDDGTSSTHDYTHSYLDIFKEANRYRDAQNRLAKGGLSADDVKKYQDIIQVAPKVAQAKLNSITGDLATRTFTGKHNIFKEGLMSHRMPHSATAIWTPDPRLKLEQVAMGEAMARTLGVKDNDETLIWRDPILRDSGTRYMQVKVDPALTGIAINPIMDKPFDGDFDGDTIGVVRLDSEAAKREARRLFSVQSNLLEQGAPGKDGKKELSFNLGLDCKVANYQHPEIKERWDKLRDEVNATQEGFDTGSVDYRDYMERNRISLDKANSITQDMFKPGMADAGLNYSNIKDHVKSVYKACIETGAKGNDKKFGNFAHWLGVNIDQKDGKFDFDSVKDTGHTLATREEQEATMFATAVKSHGTGLGGGFSQRGMAALRNESPKAVLELTYVVTQSLLQVKHNADEAKQKYSMLMGPARDLWRGAAVELDDKGQWETPRDEQGCIISAKKDDWKKSFKEFYSSPSGLNVDIDDHYVDVIADKMNEDGTMLNIDDFGNKAPLDQLAYGGDIHTISRLARQGANLFEGKNNEMFAPRSVMHNMHLDEEAAKGVAIEGERAAIGKSDVLQGGKEHGPKVQSIAVGKVEQNVVVEDVSEAVHPDVRRVPDIIDTTVAEPGDCER